MAKTYDGIDERLRAFIAAQHVFFVATAPSGGDGHVNVSPKGTPGTFVVFDERTVGYLDLTGSGAETAAHLRDNGRITVMFCSFDGPPKVLRLHGTGRLVVPDDGDWPGLAARFPDHRGARAIVVVDVQRVSDSCGYGLPILAFQGERDLLDQWTDRKDDATLVDYRLRHNTHSIDGLDALPVQAPLPAAHHETSVSTGETTSRLGG